MANNNRNQRWSSTPARVPSTDSTSSYGPGRNSRSDSDAMANTVLNSPFTPRQNRVGTAIHAGSPTPKANNSGAEASYTNGGFGSPPSRKMDSDNWRKSATPVRGRESSRSYVPPNGRNHSRNTSATPAPLARLHSELPIVTLADIIPTGPFVVHVEQERGRPNANPAYPSFLSHFANVTEDDWYTKVLPYIAKLTFVISTVADLTFLANILHAPNHPNAWHAVQTVCFPKMYWFSGVAHNRKNNPYMHFLAGLPGVREVSFTFHTAGLTTSAYNERDRIRMEKDDLEKSKNLRVLRLPDFTRHYDLQRLFACKGLRVVKMYCIDSEMVNFHVKNGDPLSPFRDLTRWVEQGFLDTQGTSVKVEAKIVKPQ